VADVDRVLRQLLDGLKRSKKNCTIGDLDTIAKEFGCTHETTSRHENRVYCPPYSDMGLVNVAMPHHGKVKIQYVSRFIRMLEDILDRRLEQEGDDD